MARASAASSESSSHGSLLTLVATAGLEAAECMPPCWGHAWGMGTAEITRSNFEHDFFSIFFGPGRRRVPQPQRLRGLDTKPSQMMERIATQLQNALSTTQEVPAHHEITDQLMAAADPADGSTSVPDTESDLKTPPPPSWPPEWSPRRLLDVLSRPGSFAIPQRVWLAADEAPEWVSRDYVSPFRAARPPPQ